MRHRTWSRWFLAIALLALIAIAAAACGDDDDNGAATTAPGGAAAKGFTDAGYKAAGFKTVTIDSGASVKIGVSSALSGDVKGLGVPIADSAETAGDGVTIKGHKVEFVREDDLCSAEGGPAAADRLIKANVVAVVGPICSGGTRASLGAYDKAGITHISPSATAGDLTTPSRAEGPYVTFFRVPVLNGDEAKAQADFAKNTLKAKTAFVVFDTDDYGKDLSQQFQNFFTAGGGKIVGSPAGYEKKQNDFKSVITSIKAAKPDLVYLAGFYGEATPFLQQLRAESDLKTTPFMGGDGVKNDELISGAKDAAENAYLALPGERGAGFANYATKYKAKYNGDAETATFGPEAYDAATIILRAIDKVAKDDGGKLTIDMKALNDAIKTTTLTDGATGTIKFGNDGNRAGAAVKFFQVKSGKYVELK
ncbi:MAG: branched-chain amino acid ABC transporter substrate-binding protein [Chloroflexi bacterium]|nr:branched-chain amino acid ABC transporter substrate-binding protein [Chloroflexota bacterium]